MSFTRYCNAEETTDPSTCLSVLRTGSSRSRSRKHRDQAVQGPLARLWFLLNYLELWSLSTHSCDAMYSSGSWRGVVRTPPMFVAHSKEQSFGYGNRMRFSAVAVELANTCLEHLASLRPTTDVDAS
jgi:hypothetical protein